MLKISRDGEGVSETLVWESPRLKAKFANPVLHEGFVYGLDDGVLVCLDPATGERRWRSGRYGHGQTLLVGNRLVVTTEDGDVVLVEASPDRHRELGRFTAFTQKLWNPPAIAGRYLLVRTDTEAACYELE
jgi:outer membrane protein assembly factor BamB